VSSYPCTVQFTVSSNRKLEYPELLVRNGESRQVGRDSLELCILRTVQ
jgi:hypothetical protein